jgi:UDP:flavonoid glycosyltransferase YjiC (YdhE family)
MTSKKRVVFSTFGSVGDLYPYLAIASAMQKQGHAVAIASGEYHRRTVERSGIRFYCTAPLCDFTDPTLQKRAFVPRTGSRFILRDTLFPQIRASYTDLLRACDGADLLVTQMLSLAGPLVAEKTGIPWVSTVLAPLSFFSYVDSPVLVPQLRRLREALPSFNSAINRAARYTTRSWSTAVREFRRELGLRPGADPIYEGQHSPTRVLALFPSILAQPQPDWPSNALVTGFPFWDELESSPSTDSALEDFLRAGSAPVVFTLGTSAVLDPGRFYDESIKAARQLGRRAILLGAPPGTSTGETKSVLTLRYAAHDRVFRGACAIVHSGGIGTTARALRAGKPALIVPWGYDQPDNAARLARLGVARTLGRTAYSARRAARELDRLLSDGTYRTNCKRVADHVQSENGVGAASAALESCLLDAGRMAEPIV